MVRRPAEAIADAVWTVGGQGNSLVVDHGEELVLVDAGPGGPITEEMIANIREMSNDFYARSFKNSPTMA
jgi:glyoxylase-like metal-dependent hydrolase (beta-lactamase superfamily II)